MPYRFRDSQEDYTDFSSGRVFHGVPGLPAFPVRLAGEIFQRCLAIRRRQGLAGTCTVYDPCCGGAYHLATLAYLHWDHIAEIIASDVDARALVMAARNLDLLTLQGMDRRIAEITQMLALYGKSSHTEALESAGRLKSRLQALATRHTIGVSLFAADATDGADLGAKLSGRHIDVVITDVPYGRLSSWQTESPSAEPGLGPLREMIDALLSVTTVTTLIAVAADKHQKITHGAYRRIERFQIGKRQVCILQPKIGGHLR